MFHPTDAAGRRSRAVVVPLAIALLLGACATGPTPYQPFDTGRISGGYTDQQIEADRFRVSFQGNRLTSRERVENYLLYRAAELATNQGYDGFTLVARDTERDVETRIDPPFRSGRFAYWNPYWSYYGPAGWRYWDPWGPDPFWGDTVDVRSVERYEASAEILLFRGTRPDDPLAFDASEVLRNLGPTIERPS